MDAGIRDNGHSERMAQSLRSESFHLMMTAV
jgi:hypothetical protein